MKEQAMNGLTVEILFLMAMITEALVDVGLEKIKMRGDVKIMDKERIFEDFLTEKHADQYEGLDDGMPDDYSEWLGNLDTDEVIQYANEYIKKELQKLLEQVLLEKIAEIENHQG